MLPVYHGSIDEPVGPLGMAEGVHVGIPGESILGEKHIEMGAYSLSTFQIETGNKTLRIDGCRTGIVKLVTEKGGPNGIKGI